MMKSSVESIATALKIVREKVEIAQKQSKKANKVNLVGVSKTKPIELILEAYNAGLRHFGENYVDELASKYSNLPQDIQWHFIGHLQSNKCKEVVIPNLYVVETIDSIKLATKLNKQCQKIGKNSLNVFVQILTSDEDTKYGITQDKCFELIEFIIQKCPNLKFQGLMTIGKEGDYEAFNSLFNLRQKVCDQFKLDIKNIELSMGMSGDFEKAIECGSTNIRVGSSIFGARQYPPKTEAANEEKKIN